MGVYERFRFVAMDIAGLEKMPVTGVLWTVTGIIAYPGLSPEVGATSVSPRWDCERP